MNDRIPTHIWVEAKIRELSARGVGVYVANRGELMGGMVLVKVSNMAGKCRLMTQQRNFDTDKLEWIPALTGEVMEEKDADAYIARSADRDPDLWVLEVEDRQMVNPFAD